MTPEAELAEAKAMAKKVGYGSGSLASVIENLAELSATARRALDDLVKMRNVCRNPNHSMPDGTPHPHEIGPSCMAESAAPEAEQNAIVEPVLAIIKEVGYGCRDVGRPVLWFNTFIRECVAALQIFAGKEADDIITAYKVHDVHDLEGKPCWVREEGGMIRWVKPWTK